MRACVRATHCFRPPSYRIDCPYSISSPSRKTLVFGPFFRYPRTQFNFMLCFGRLVLLYENFCKSIFHGVDKEKEAGKLSEEFLKELKVEADLLYVNLSVTQCASPIFSDRFDAIFFIFCIIISHFQKIP